MFHQASSRTTRRGFLIGAAGAAVVGCFSVCPGASASAGPLRGPNILWIVTDDHRPDSLGCTGPSWLKTPHMDGIARRGVLFRHAFSQCPICTPSRSSMITGRYCHSIGVTAMGAGQRLGPNAPYLTRPLQAAGYQLINVGKKLPSPKIFDIEIGAQGYDDPGATPYKLKPPFEGMEKELGVLHLNKQCPVIVAGRHPLPASRTEPAITINNAIALVRKGLKSPFLLRVSIMAPHVPVLPPEPFDTMYDAAEMPFEPPTDEELAGAPRWEREALRKLQGSVHLTKRDVQRARACYFGLVSHMDREIGRLMAEIEQLGLLEDMLVVVTSDQGWCLGEHGVFGKRCFYEQSAGAILIISWPGHVPEGKVIDDPVELVGVMPTMLDAGGIKLPPNVQGASLLPLIRGDEDAPDAVFSEIDFSKSMYPCLRMPNSRRVMVRTRHWKMSYFVERVGDARDGDLYDLTNDPEERRNLWKDKTYADVVARLEARVMQWDEETKN
jgi:arylsulfatase